MNSHVLTAPHDHQIRHAVTKFIQRRLSCTNSLCLSGGGILTISLWQGRWLSQSGSACEWRNENFRSRRGGEATTSLLTCPLGGPESSKGTMAAQVLSLHAQKGARPILTCLVTYQNKFQDVEKKFKLLETFH